jgi:hypothetical protein
MVFRYTQTEALYDCIVFAMCDTSPVSVTHLSLIVTTCYLEKSANCGTAYCTHFPILLLSYLRYGRILTELRVV